MLKRILLKPRFEGHKIHSLYSEIIRNPPPGYAIEYRDKFIQNSRIYTLDNKAANPVLRELIYHLKPIIYIASQKKQKNNFEGYDMVYASQHVLFNSSIPWITDLEFVNALAAFGNVSLIKNWIRKQLETEKCKFIMPWSEWAKETLILSMDYSKFKEKIKVIRYTVNPKKVVKHKHDGIEFLFVGSSNPMNVKNIQFKNLKETILAFNRISEKYDGVHLTLRSYLPPNLKFLVEHNPMISIIDSFLDIEDLYKLYLNADIFVLPSHETCGIAILDAMSFELPVIAMNIYDMPEVITHMQNGILIDGHKDMQYYTKYKSPSDYSWKFVSGIRKYSDYIVNQLELYFAKLVEDSSLRNKLAVEARKTIEKGRLSIEKRNKDLAEVFEATTK